MLIMTMKMMTLQEAPVESIKTLVKGATEEVLMLLTAITKTATK